MATIQLGKTMLLDPSNTLGRQTPTMRLCSLIEATSTLQRSGSVEGNITESLERVI